MTDLTKRYGLEALEIIEKKNGKARYNEILLDFGATSGTLSRVLKILEKEGYIERIVDTNARPPISYYKITERGRQLIIKKSVEDLNVVAKNPALSEEDKKKIEEIIKRIRKYANSETHSE